MTRKILCALALIMGLCSCGKKGAQSETANGETEEEQNEVLVAYFSATGTTKRIALMIAESIRADLLEITPAEPYTEADLDWRDKQSRTTIEMQDTTARPAMKFEIPDLTGYKLIYLGYPIWWGVAPRIINTFLETANLTDTIQIVPFATSGGSPVEPSVNALRASYPNLKWEDGILLNHIDDSGYHIPDEDLEEEENGQW